MKLSPLEIFMIVISLSALYSKFLQIKMLCENKSSKNVAESERWLLLFCFICWGWYGWYKDSIAIFIINVGNVFLTSIIIFLCRRYNDRNKCKSR